MASKMIAVLCFEVLRIAKANAKVRTILLIDGTVG
jgi:hypothetical protein